MRRIPINKVKPGMINKKTVLGFLGQVLLCTGVQIKARHIYYLKRTGIEYLYVEDARMSGFAYQDLISSETRSQGQALVSDLFRDLDALSPNPRIVDNKKKEINSFTSKVVEELLENDNPVIQISDLRPYAGYLFAHSVNCCVIATLLASRMNYDRNTLKKIATGALLHDLGYINTPRLILRKPARLTEAEHAEIKKHTQFGYELFKKTRLFTARIAEIILQHHERHLGQGYPLGLRGKKISAWARIVAVADVFDAITSDKHYRRAYAVHEAVKMMQRWGEEYFDPEVISAFNSVAACYPLGSCVRLSSGEVGLVVANKVGFMASPTVRVIYRDDLSAHPAPYVTDLSVMDEVQVVSVADDFTDF